MTDCPFCPENWGNLDIVERPLSGFAVINPLNPVTKGHVLVIAAEHSEDAGEDPEESAQLMLLACEYLNSRRNEGIQANIITSIGPDATQTVMHTHVHVVPRRKDDGLLLPWTPQQLGYSGGYKLSPVLPQGYDERHEENVWRAEHGLEQL